MLVCITTPGGQQVGQRQGRISWSTAKYRLNRFRFRRSHLFSTTGLVAVLASAAIPLGDGGDHGQNLRVGDGPPISQAEHHSWRAWLPLMREKRRCRLKQTADSSIIWPYSLGESAPLEFESALPQKSRYQSHERRRSTLRETHALRDRQNYGSSHLQQHIFFAFLPLPARSALRNITPISIPSVVHLPIRLDLAPSCWKKLSHHGIFGGNVDVAACCYS